MEAAADFGWRPMDDELEEELLSSYPGPVGPRPDGADGFALSYDEWNARRVAIGCPVGSWGDYLNSFGIGQR